ncbi:MAG: tRNA (guanosine(46)-N7)-methyltransferase TrmB [Verrucomicrobiota bacterium]
MASRKKKEPFPFPHELYPEDWFSRLEREDLFPDEGPIELDLGCGDGSFLARISEGVPETRFLGVERLLGRVRKVNRKIDQAGLKNARILRADSNYAVKWLLPREAFQRIHFLCPDPWPKKKHARRRQMCQLLFLQPLHDLLVPDGELLFLTDAHEYFEEALEVQETCDFFEQEPWEEGDFFYPKTDFEEQWLAEGKTMNRLRLRRK